MSGRNQRPAGRLRFNFCTQAIVWGVVQCCSGQSLAATPTLERKVTFYIQEQPLDSALIEFSKQAGVPVTASPIEIERMKAPALSGTMQAGDALTKLLEQSGLHYEEFGDTVTVLGGGAGAVPPSRKTPGTASASSFFPDSTGPRGSADRGPGSTLAQSDDRVVLEEVVVTAQKRLERLQDVPIPVTAINTDDLVSTNQLRLQDYYTQIPGLSVTPADTRGAPILAIRGITTGGSLNPTVGITIDDIPYGATTTFGGGFAAPDIDPSDLARIEVLRGPQGTLYGASSIGGLLKFITVDPSMDGVSGRLQGGVSSTKSGEGVGYNARGAVNIPLGDEFAVRASAFSRKDPGYIDNVLTGRAGVNQLDTSGGRLSGLWNPADTVTLKLSALIQHSAAYGASEVDLDAGLGDLQQSRVRNTGRFDKKIQAYSATLTANLGSVDVTSLTGYSVNRSSDSQDFTAFLGPYTLSQFGVSGTPTFEHSKTTKVTQEFRFTVPVGDAIQWLAGLFYTHEKSSYTQDILAADPVTGALAGLWSDDVIPSSYEEYAAFTDVTVHVAPRFDVQVGGRESQNKQTYAETIIGPLDALLYPTPSPVVNPEIATKDNAFTYLVTPQFKVSPDLMIYARLASGYRPGGPNPTSTVYGVPPSYKPDKTNNYEVGVKGNALNHALAFDASAYYIDWKDIQLTFVDPQTFGSYFVNASRAKSQGLELSAESRPLAELTVAAWVAWNDAVLTKDLPIGGPGTPVGISGDRLPSSSRFSGNFSVEQEFFLPHDIKGFVGGAVSYVGSREGVFTQTEERQHLPAYAKTDLRAGVKADSWAVNLYGTNVTDRRGVLTGGIGTFVPTAFTYIQPRTVGISIEKSF
jgi:iron complex outermembrane recepter protein